MIYTISKKNEVAFVSHRWVLFKHYKIVSCTQGIWKNNLKHNRWKALLLAMENKCWPGNSRLELTCRIRLCYDRMRLLIDLTKAYKHKIIGKMPHPCVVCGRSRMNPNNREEDYMFFGFPVNDEPRCRKWLEFCCREDLYKLTKKQLLQRMVCSKHFQRKDFLNDYLDRLNATAVPSIYDRSQAKFI